MSAVQFHCPLCSGLFQVDDSLAGIEVSCPHCAGLVTVPSFDAPPLPSAEPMELACPLCAGPFQVGPELAGQEVTCPHCANVVGVPGIEYFPVDSRHTPPQPGWGFEPPPAQSTFMHFPPADYSVSPFPDTQFPPGHFAPGDQPPFSAQRHPIESARIAVSSPTPQGVDALLPPGATPATTKQPRASDLLPPEQSSLLPPAASGKGTPAERVPLPANVPTRSKKDPVRIPTEKGLLSVHEPVKTIVHRGQEVELRQLTPEEKSQRRMIRNAIFFVGCLTVLILVMAALSWRQWLK